MTPAFELRPGRADDAAVLADLGYRRWGEAHRDAFTPADLETALAGDWNEARLTAELTDPSTTVIVGDDGHRAIGLCALRPGTVPGTDEAVLELCRLYIEPEYLGSGLGGALVNAILEVADARQDRSRLIVWERNELAIALYKRRGYEVATTYPYVVGDSAPTAVLMIRPRPDSAAPPAP